MGWDERDIQQAWGSHNCRQNSVLKPSIKDLLEDECVDGRIILKRVLNNVTVGTGLNRLRTRESGKLLLTLVMNHWVPLKQDIS
jgi:hypothetical protein